MTDSTLAVLEQALAFGDTIVIVRSGAATAEVMGGPVRRGQEWLTVGDEGAGASHVHIKLSEIDALRFRQTDGRNAALDVLNANGEVICSLSFRKTNAGRAETFDADRLANVKARFGHLAEVPA
jgi:putative heme degradation protein